MFVLAVYRQKDVLAASHPEMPLDTKKIAFP